MTGEQILKALECCSNDKCWECPYEPNEYKKCTFGCSQEMMVEGVDLINRQKAEIEKLDLLIQSLNLVIIELNKDCEGMESKLERLRDIGNKLKKEKAKYKWDTKNWIIKNTDLDNLVKEMVGD